MSLLLDRFLLPLASFCPILFAQIATRRRGDPRGSPKSVENFNRILGERRKKINFPWHLLANENLWLIDAVMRCCSGPNGKQMMMAELNKVARRINCNSAALISKGILH